MSTAIENTIELIDESLIITIFKGRVNADYLISS